MTRKDYVQFANKVVELKTEFPTSAFPQMFEDHVLEVFKREPTFSLSKWKAYISRKMDKKNIDNLGCLCYH